MTTLNIDRGLTRDGKERIVHCIDGAGHEGLVLDPLDGSRDQRAWAVVGWCEPYIMLGVQDAHLFAKRAGI